MIEKVVDQDPEIKSLHEHSLNTVRVVTFKDRSGSAKVDLAVLKMGASESRVDSWRRGGLAANVDLVSGTLSRGARLKKKGWRGVV